MKDLEIQAAIEEEAKRQLYNIELIASENYVSDEVMEAAGSILTNKYAEGYPSKRYYGGCVNVDVVETLPESVYAVFLEPSMRMCSRIQDPRLIWVFIWLFLNLVIRCWEWILAPADT